jgi:hypothetical protein
VTVNPREVLPNVRGRQTHAVIDAAARAVLGRKGFVVTTGSDTAGEAGRSAGSSYNYYDSVKSMMRTAQHDGYRRGGFPKLIALALVSMRNYYKETGPT